MSLEVKFLTDYVQIQPAEPPTLEDFVAFCAENPLLRIEREPGGNISLNAPLPLLSADAESHFHGALYLYASQQGGRAFSANATFALPDGSIRMPDAGYMTAQRFARLTPADKLHFPTIAPDFVVEVRSKSDSLKRLRQKMSDSWIGNGVRLAWLVDLKRQRTYVYRENGSVDMLEGFDRKLSGEEVLPGFEFDLRLLMVV